MGLVTVFWPAMTTDAGELVLQNAGEARFVVSIIEVIWLMRLWRAEPVETGGIIRPLRVAEIGRAAGERVGGHRRPDGMAQVRAGFHHHDPAAGPGDVESKLIRLHAEARIAGLHLRQ